MATSCISVSMSEIKINKYCLSLAFLIMLYTLNVKAQETFRGEDIFQTIQKYGQAEVVISYPGFDVMSRLANDFSVSSCDGQKAVLCLSNITAPAFIKKNISYTIIKPDNTKSTVMASTVAEAMGWDSYPSYTQYDSIMHAIAELYPEKCRLDTIGLSINGRVIYAIKISDNPLTDEDEPKVFLGAAIHGDELCGFVLMMRLAELLASDDGSDELVTRITTNLEVWINPLSNPDGMYRSGDEIVNPVRANANGIDLNRNFPDPEVNNTIQKENIAMVEFLKKHQFALSVEFHSGEEVVNYPWDRWTRLHADNDWFYDISRRYADTVHLHSSPDYMTYLDNGVTNGAAWYVINGGRQDYVTWNLEGREVTIELDDNKLTYAGQLDVLWNSNHRSFLRYISEALTGVRGMVTDSETGTPVEAEVFISGHDSEADSSWVYSDKTTGGYLRLLSPGTYSIVFIADGYNTFIASDVMVTEGDITFLDVQLTIPDSERSPVWPVPSTGDVNILLPERMTGLVKFSVISVSGLLVDTFTEYYFPYTPLSHSFSHLSSGVYFLNAKKSASGQSVTYKMVIVSKEP